MKITKLWVFVALLIALGTAALLPASQTVQAAVDQPPPVTVAATQDATIQSCPPSISRGASGRYVYMLQTALYLRGYFASWSDVDGSFGPRTEAAVNGFKFDQGLTVNGVVDSTTWHRLGFC